MKILRKIGMSLKKMILLIVTIALASDVKAVNIMDPDMLYGYVYDETGAGLNGANVTAYWPDISCYNTTIPSGMASSTTPTHNGTDGYYSLGLPTGTFCTFNLTLTVYKDLGGGTYYWYNETMNTADICSNYECEWNVYLGQPIPELPPLALLAAFLGSLTLHAWRKTLRTRS